MLLCSLTEFMRFMMGCMVACCLVCGIMKGFLVKAYQIFAFECKEKKCAKGSRNIYLHYYVLCVLRMRYNMHGIFLSFNDTGLKLMFANIFVQCVSICFSIEDGIFVKESADMLVCTYLCTLLGTLMRNIRGWQTHVSGYTQSRL